MSLPFEQYIKENRMVRVFTPDVPADELKWHQDLKDRMVTVVKEEDGNSNLKIFCQTNYIPDKKLKYRNLPGTEL